MFLGVNCELRRAPNLPYIEVSAVVANVDMKNSKFIYLQIAMRLVDLVQKNGGLIIAPFGEVPKDKTIFFTAQFKTNLDTENFIRVWEAMGY